MPFIKLKTQDGPVRVPDSELIVLYVLHKIGKAHGTAIVEASDGTVALPSVYKFLDRLGKKGLVVKTVEPVPVDEVQINRAFYQITPNIDRNIFARV